MNILKNILVAATLVVVLISCRREPEEKPVFPAVEYFSPSVVTSENAEVKLLGTGLDKAVITVGGQVVNIVKSEVDANGRGYVTFVLPAGLSEGKHPVKVVFEDETEASIAAPLIFNKSALNVAKAEMLIGDFDFGGVRAAGPTKDFSDGNWLGDPGANTVMGIVNSVNGINSSPAGGNFVFATVPSGGILPNTYGYVGALISRNEIQNDLTTGWPESFINYPNSVLNFEKGVDKVSDFYLNFYVNFNSLGTGQVRIYLGSSDIAENSKFSFTISPDPKLSADLKAKRKVSEQGWQFVSIKFSDMLGNYGFGGCSASAVPCAINDEFITKINQMSFSLSDSYNNVYDPKCCTGKNIACCATAIKDPVQIYIDHVTITQGAPAYDYSK